MSDALAQYLEDHLAGSNFAIELLNTLRDEHAGEPIGAFAGAVLAEVTDLRAVLERIIDQVGKERAPLKQATAWVGEKLSQFKLSRASSGEVGTFEALELLALGVHGQIALWRALPVIARSDARIPAEDFGALAKRAQDLHDRVEERRLQVAATAFRASSE